MKRIVIFCFFAIPFLLFSQNHSSGWIINNEPAKTFIENKSQFDGKDKLVDSKILYGIDQNGTQIYFTKQGLTYRFDEKEKKDVRKEEREGEEENKKMSAEDWAAHEMDERKVKIKTDIVHLQWEGANPNVQVVVEDLDPAYYSYMVGKENINYIRGYKKLIYKNLYPNIDIEYVFHPQDGIKYSLVLHPGADVSQVKMKYSDVDKIFTDKSGNIHLSTLFGDMIDHAPLVYYSENKSSIIASQFVKTGKTISFSLGNYDKARTVVIDPWFQTPTLANSNGVWECERDGAGNVYIIGGDSPMKLQKYNSAGVFQWTYATPWDTANNWLGTLATDLAGNSYVTSGSVAAMQKIDASGNMVWNKTGGLFSSDEYWTISFNCDQTKLIVGGTSGNNPTSLMGAIYDINTSNGNVNSKVFVGTMFLSQGYINEVRSISPSHNGRYYYLTLDSIGCVDQNFATCPNGNPIFAFSSGYSLAYKCENYRTISNNGGNAGIKSIKANQNFVYTANGTNIQKRSLATGTVLNTVAIPGGASSSSFGRNIVSNSGIDIDTCGNVYVGSCGAVIKYDANLNVLSQVALPFNVYDVAVSTNGDVIVCGATGIYSDKTRTGYVQSISSFAACKPLTLQCCDATVCKAGPFCTTDAAQTLSPSTSGGTWSGIGITNTSTGVFSPAVAGAGTFTITYNIGCGKDSTQIVVKPCATLSVCAQSNGDLTVSGGVGPYHWDVASTTLDCSSCPFGQCAPPICNGVTTTTWNNYSTSATATPPGTWPIRVVDANSNTSVINSLSGISPCNASVLSVSATHTNPVCHGQCTGTAMANTSGGTAPLTYSWNSSPVQASQTASGLCSGNYTVLVTDASANTATATVSITQPTALTSSASVTSASCGSGGSAAVSANGGTTAYTYSWSNGQSTSAVTGLTAGNYTATVTDANGCTTISTVSVNAASGGTVSVNSSTILCNGETTNAVANMSGGTSPFTYIWSGGQTTSSVTGLGAGNYFVHVTDANGCATTQSVTITQPTAISSSVSGTNTTCGASTGTAAVSASGGTGTLSYSWSNGLTTASVSGLGVGNYTCTITDGNGCKQVQTTNIINANGPNATVSSQTITCNGGSNGSAAVTTTGGTSPYTYSWTNGQTTSSATGLAIGIYSVTVTDASGCSNVQSVTITEPTAITATATITAATCGQSDGSATVNPSGGTLPFTYLWAPSSQVTQTATGLSAGNYSALITDANGCSKTFTTAITNSNGPIVVAGTSTSIMQGGSAALTASGGVSYVWSPSTSLSNPNISNPVAHPNATTKYCVIVTDAGGCTDSACVTIYVEAPCNDNYYLPNAFSPNNDNENDVLKIYPPDISKCIKEYKLTIYDRWGENIFETPNPSESWDGTRHGKMMDTQVVVYYLHIVFIDGKEISKQGNISLIR